ncbi:protoglobin domain-containing protein [Cytobacillus sp. FJAT-54145]|uniref:Protoglobin domain-containing protein n=1 Tax=Cytobacillus spartinae TaxID=3299023 RepID=A0ABW6KJ62_9BACI
MSIQVDPNWTDLVHYIGLKQEHLDLLHDHKEFFERYTNEVVMNFYIRVVKNETLYKIVNQHSTFDRVKKTQSMYYRSLFSDKIDAVYIMYVQKIAHVHFRIGLNPEWYLAGVQTYLDEIYNLCKDMEQGIEIYQAFTKRIMFDTQVCLAEYEKLKENSDESSLK